MAPVYIAHGRLPMWPFCGPSVPAWLLGIPAYIGCLCAECMTTLGWEMELPVRSTDMQRSSSSPLLEDEIGVFVNYFK